MGGGVGLIGVWIAATVLGVSFARSVPEPRAYGLDFAFAAAFIAILRSLWRGAEDLLPWGAAIAATGLLVAATPLEPSWALAVGGVVGAVTAGWRQRG